MQFLFDKSYEFGEHAGLGIISGEVKQLSVQPGTFCKIPHIGWNALWPPDGKNSFSGHLLDNVTPGSQVYFVHSFVGYAASAADVLANTRYCDSVFPSVVCKANTFGVQFHPEKSGAVGIQILKNFISLL